jgi:hypothetical protein
MSLASGGGATARGYRLVAAAEPAQLAGRLAEPTDWLGGANWKRTGGRQRGLVLSLCLKGGGLRFNRCLRWSGGRVCKWASAHSNRV